MQGDEDNYRQYMNKANRMAKSLKYVYYKSKVASLKEAGPSRWWREVKQLTASHSRPQIYSAGEIDCVCAR